MKTMKSIFFVVLAVLTTFPAYAVDATNISSATISRIFLRLLDSPNAEEVRVSLGRGKVATATLDVTSKGNGTFSIGDLTLRLLDTHDDGLIYKNQILDVDSTDLNGDGLLDFVVFGTIIHTGEKESDPRTEELVVFIYTQESDGKSFREAYKKSTISIRLGKK